MKKILSLLVMTASIAVFLSCGANNNINDASVSENKFLSSGITGKDFREESIYFIMTARFFDGDSSNNRYCRADDKSGNRANNDPPWRGDFKGLIQKLDYIKALGFTSLWITPVVQNRSDFDFHGYHAWDFTQIDKRLESPGATFQDLINACHTRGMKLVLDIVLNHSCRYGIKDAAPVKYWGNSADAQWGDGTKMDYYDVYNPSFTYNGLDAEPISGKTWYNGDLWQSGKPSLPWNPDLTYWGLTTGQYSPEGYKIYHFQWPTEESISKIFNPQWYHPFFLKNWEDETCQTGSIHEDCIDLDTESTVVQNYLTNAYNRYIDMGVDAFRVDTVKHVSRVMFNRHFVPAFKARGGSKFFMFGEVCTRVNEVWNHGNPPLSTPFYTWKERTTYSADDHSAVHESYVYENAQGVGNQPVSTNAALSGNDYHAPDYSAASGMSVIDFPVHWNFSNASSAWNQRGNDKYYNDATWNVVYVDSHDYGPNMDNRYNGGTTAWAENFDLMFTWRGIPCVYYGSEIEFQAGAPADKGPSMPLASTGRAYYGANIEGSITATDFGQYSNASGAVAATLAKPLPKHLARINVIRRSIPALQKGQYSTEGCNGQMAFKKRFTDTAAGIDSFCLITISSNATYTGIPNGTYLDAITGDVQTVTGGTLTTTGCDTQGNMRIYVLNGPGKIGEDTQWLKGSGSVPTVPAVPSGVTASAVSSSSITIIWPASAGAASYTVYQSSSSNGTFASIGTASGTAFTAGGLLASTTYYYKVTATNSAGSSGYSSAASATTQSQGTTAPAAPTNVNASAASSSAINLSWSASTGAASYTVYQSNSSNGSYNSVGTVSGTSFTATGLSASTTYYYQVTAANSGGTSGYSSVASATTQSSGTATGLKVHCKVNSFANWTAVNCYFWGSNGSSSSNSWPGTAATSEGSGWFVFTVPGATSSNVIFNNGSGSVQTVDLSRSAEGWFVPTGNSGGKITGTWTDTNPDGPGTPPSAPATVTVLGATSSSISLSWAVSSSATTYTVYQSSSSNGTYNSIGTAATTSFTVTGLTASTTYYFKVTATNSYGTSALSAAVSATTSPQATGLRVHVKVNSIANWTNVYCYYWGSNGSNSWPGTAATSEGNNWWVYTISGTTSSNVIFDGGSGASQTVDMSRSAEGWFVPTGTSGGKVTGTWYNTNPGI